MMRLYQAIFISLLGHGALLLPLAEHSSPDISIAPMQISLNSATSNIASVPRKQPTTESRSKPKGKSHIDNIQQETVANIQPASQAVKSVRNPVNQTEVRSDKTASIQNAEISKPVNDTPFVPATFAIRDVLSQQQAQTYVISRLHKALKNYFEYPLLARSNGWEGRVVLALDVYLDGRIHNVQLKSGSGYRLLDRSALKAVSRIRILQDIPTWQGSAPLNIDIPVIYRLQG